MKKPNNNLTEYFNMLNVIDATSEEFKAAIKIYYELWTNKQCTNWDYAIAGIKINKCLNGKHIVPLKYPPNASTYVTDTVDDLNDMINAINLLKDETDYCLERIKKLGIYEEIIK